MVVEIKNLPKVISIEHSVEPLWASDAGREANDASFSGTFKGWFDKLKITFGHTTQTELTQIKTALEKPIIEDVKFIDSNSGNDKTEDFYGTAISVKKSNLKGLYSGFTITLTAIKKR